MKADSGMTIIEVLIALALLGLTLSILTTSMISNANLNDTIDKRGQAIRLAEKLLERYRYDEDSYGDLASKGIVESKEEHNGYIFPVKTTFCPSDMPKQMVCDDSSVYIRLEVLNNNKVLYKTETYYTELGGKAGTAINE